MSEKKQLAMHESRNRATSAAVIWHIVSFEQKYTERPYQDVTKVLLPPPLPFLLKLLTPLARLLGYRSSYPQYRSAQPRPEAELLADA